MVDLSTHGALFEHEHSLAAYCQHCDRWTVLDLEVLVAAGHGTRRRPIKARYQVRPTVPMVDPQRVAWISPR